MELTSRAIVIQALLFVSQGPVSLGKLARASGYSPEDVRDALENLRGAMNGDHSGIHVFEGSDGWFLGTHPGCSEVIQAYTSDTPSELSRPALETLTVIAYRGPLTQPEIEAIRGVHCSLILRNLLMRGLILEKYEKEKSAVVYTLSSDTLRYLGVHRIEELPDYEAFHQHEHVNTLLGSSSPPLC